MLNKIELKNNQQIKKIEEKLKKVNKSKYIKQLIGFYLF